MIHRHRLRILIIVAVILFLVALPLTLAEQARWFDQESLVAGLVYTLLATLVLVFVILLMNRYVPRMSSTIESWKGTRIRSIRLQSVEILPEDRIIAVLLHLLKGARLVILLTLLYFYIPLVFSFFPWTRELAATLFDYLLTPFKTILQAGLAYLPKLFFVGAIVLVTSYIIKFTRLFFREAGKQTITIPGFYPEWADPTFKIVRFLIIAFAAVVAFPYLPGSESPAFKGISLFLGVLLSLGSTSAIANIVAGVILTYMRAFKLGDRVKIADTVGDVVDKTLLVTRIRTIKNVDITVPNSMVLGSHIVNFSSSAKDYGLILNTSVTIGYDAPWRQVHELLLAAALATDNILALPKPFVLQTGLNDFFVTYEINAYTENTKEMARTYSLLHQNIQDKFNEAGVEIMSPHYANLRDGNRTTIPENYPAGTPEPPAFKIRVSPEPPKTGQ